MNRSRFIWLAACALALHPQTDARAQRVFIGGGVGSGSIPRAENPLCGSARRLTGPSLSAQAGVQLERVRIGADVDFVSTTSVEMASCVPRQGVSVDSLFAEAGSSATTVGASAWVRAAPMLSAGLALGFVPGHRSWFVGSGVSAQYRWLRAEAMLRRHATSYDEITRDFSQQPVREVSRVGRTEAAWGWIARVLIVL